jgi:hypothetical protein
VKPAAVSARRSTHLGTFRCGLDVGAVDRFDGVERLGGALFGVRCLVVAGLRVCAVVVTVRFGGVRCVVLAGFGAHGRRPRGEVDEISGR